MKVRRPRIVSSTLLFYIDIRALTSTMNFLKPTRRPAVILMKAAWHHHHSIRSKFLHPHQGCLWPPVPPQPPLLPHLHPEARAAPANLSPPWPLWSGIRVEADPREKCDFQLLHLTQVQVEFSLSPGGPQGGLQPQSVCQQLQDLNRVHHVGGFSSFVTSAKLPNLSELQFS